MLGYDLGFAIRGGKRDINLSVERYEHIDLPITLGEQRDVCRKGLLTTVETQALDHLVRQFGECEVRTKVRSVPCIGLALSVAGHGRLDLLAECVILF